MQISDALGRYNTNMTPGAAGAAATQKEQPVQNKDRTGGLSGLQAGQVFEGTVGTVKNGQVQLQLSNGATISARLGGNVPLQQGQSLFFEVKSNEGGTIEIKPFETAGGLANPTILSALDAAGLSATPDHMKMVQTLMQEQMSIDKQSLGSMARLVSNNPGIEPSTLIEMTKLGFPISDEMAAQFENYKTDSYQILNKMNEILESVTNTLGGGETSGKDALALNEKLIQILSGGETTQTAQMTGEAAGPATAGETAAAGNAGEAAAAGAANAQADAGAAQNAKAADAAGVLKTPDAQEQSAQQGKILSQGEALLPENPDAAAKLPAEGENAQKTVAAGTLRETLSKEEMQELVKNIKTLDQDGSLAKAGLSFDLSPEEFAKRLNAGLQDLKNPDESALKNLLSGKGYLHVLQEMTKDQWTVKPEQLSGDRMKDLYENLDRQMRQTETMLREMGLKDTDLAKSVADLKNNLEFMDMVNQNYTYLQIPLQFQNQTAHSDLYVFTNKKNLQDPDAELTAFLHLDMEHLGATDVSVRMKNRAVNTKFYMESDEAFDLVMAHADELAKRLEEKGYSCKIEAVNDAKEMNPVNDFLKQGQNAGQMIHRYSFDIKA
ncbi:MAG: flagellar hook-length control protein FliK [Lachnospiraceae bacterium]|nr:flagellar hook-length control protein FliK [Lachnospiraceae bacterium]